MRTLHGKIAGLTLLTVLLWAVTESRILQRASISPIQAEIAVEHTGRARMTLHVSEGASVQVMEFINSSDEALKISMPETWRRTEVRGVPLAEVTGEDAALGFRRWTLPPGSTVQFDTTEPWQTLLVHHPASAVLNLRLTRVDVKTGMVERSAHLLDEGTHRIP